MTALPVLSRSGTSLAAAPWGRARNAVSTSGSSVPTVRSVAARCAWWSPTGSSWRSRPASPTMRTFGWRLSSRISSPPPYPVAPMIPTRIRLGPPSDGSPRDERGRIPDGRSVSIAVGDPSPALTGARGLSQGAGSGGSPGSDGPSSWAYDDTSGVHKDASRAAVPGRLQTRAADIPVDWSSFCAIVTAPRRPGDRPMPDAIPASAVVHLPPARMIDPRGHRFGAGVSASMLIVAAVTGTPWLVALALLSIAVSGVFGLRYSIYGVVWRRIAAAAGLGKVEPEHEYPPRFAQVLGSLALT